MCWEVFSFYLIETQMIPGLYDSKLYPIYYFPVIPQPW